MPSHSGSVACFVCGSAVREAQPFCGRCGGRPVEESAVDRAVDRLTLVAGLIRRRVWFGLDREVAAIKTCIGGREDVALACEPALGWLVGEVPGLAFEPDVPRVVEVAGLVFGLVRGNAYPQVREQVGRLSRFVRALKDAERAWEGGRGPSSRKAAAWLADQAGLAGMSAEEARESVYETPEHWPVVAATIDPRASQDAAWKVELARAEADSRNKALGSARDRFRAVLALDPTRGRAHEGLGAVLRALGQTREAVAHFRQATRCGDATASAWNNFAWSLATADAPTEAELGEAFWAARRAVFLAPRAVCWDTLAEVLARRGDLVGALAASRESIRLEPDRASYRERIRGLLAALAAAKPHAGEKDLAADADVDALDDDSGSEVFALDEDDVDQNAATTLDDEAWSRDLGGGFDEAVPEPPPREKAPARVTRGLGDASAVAGAGGSARAELPGPVTDRVHFSLTAPTALEPGGSYALDVWAHLDAHRAEVLERARESQGTTDLRIKTKSGVQVARGAVLTVRLAIPTLELSDPEDVILWDGAIGNATFPVTVPVAARLGPHAGLATFHVDLLTIAKLHFVLEVGRRTAAAVGGLSVREARCQRAFASYASEDRDEVLGRLQGILKVLPDLDLFLDVASMRSGEHWEQRLYQELARRETLFLFWSRAASRSPWVEREWRTAFALHGIGAIDPVPLASPEQVPPPAELAEHLHFNDWLLAFMRGRQGTLA